MLSFFIALLLGLISPSAIPATPNNNDTVTIYNSVDDTDETDTGGDTGQVRPRK